MPQTLHLGLPLIAAGQAQKHVTHNEAIAGLDALVQLAVAERNRVAPPAAPANGVRFIVGGGATGAFAGQDGRIAHFDDGAWRFYTPAPGYIAYVEAEGLVLVFDGSAWANMFDPSESLDERPIFGVNTAADIVNRLSVVSNAVLFSALGTGAGGSGDHRLVLNKEAAGKTVSQLYQSGFSGRAETGLTGDDDFRIKVSPDGGAWREALRVDRTSGEVSLPSTFYGLRNLIINSDFALNQRVFAGGASSVNVYLWDRWRTGAGGLTSSRTPDGVLTINGLITQNIENPGLANQVVTVSVEDPSGSLNVDVAGATGTITAGSGRRGIALTVPVAATGNVKVGFSGAGVSFARPMMSRGSGLIGYERLPIGLLLMLCQRYYEKTYDIGTAPNSTGLSGIKIGRTPASGSNVHIETLTCSFATRKRATPSQVWYSTSPQQNRIRDVTASADVTLSGTGGVSEWSTGTPILSTATAGNQLYAQWTAEAEI